ncbi:MAG: hypothetical protein NC211_03185 [Alistipes senegalensis]|nr:hypothetical protein [Oxalobacter formigenes]MCM1280825.1 hypothetical protein [Alistipes senegalensis]
MPAIACHAAMLGYPDDTLILPKNIRQAGSNQAKHEKNVANTAYRCPLWLFFIMMP